jgi:hypothetical protein
LIIERSSLWRRKRRRVRGRGGDQGEGRRSREVGWREIGPRR